MVTISLVYYVSQEGIIVIMTMTMTTTMVCTTSYLLPYEHRIATMPKSPPLPPVLWSGTISWNKADPMSSVGLNFWPGSFFSKSLENILPEGQLIKAEADDHPPCHSAVHTCMIPSHMVDNVKCTSKAIYCLWREAHPYFQLMGPLVASIPTLSLKTAVPISSRNTFLSRVLC